MTSKNEARIQFYDGINEPVVPEIRLTRGKGGSTGQAFFIFEKPQALSKLASGEIIGMKMIDEEGELITKEVKARFVDGSPTFIEAIFSWTTKDDFERFMRFANSYAKANGLGYSEKN